MIASDVMNASAALLNDTALTKFTYAYQLPYLNIALSDLQEIYQQHNVPVTNADSTTIVVPAGTTRVAFNSGLPPDLVEIREIWEGLNDAWIPMTKKDFLPHWDTPISQFLYWAWIGQEIHLPEANADIDLKLDYIRNLFAALTQASDAIRVINSKSYLTFRTAALCAAFIGENESRAAELNREAELAMNRSLGISAKGQQAMATRRQPFMAGYRRRGNSYEY